MIKPKRLNRIYEEERKLLFDSQRNINNNENENENNYKNIEIKESNNEENIGVFDSWWKYFIAYFLASVGDKSQVATIFLTSKYNFISIFNL